MRDVDEDLGQLGQEEPASEPLPSEPNTLAQGGREMDERALSAEETHCSWKLSCACRYPCTCPAPEPLDYEDLSHVGAIGLALEPLAW